jgi:hypothetical protein
MSVEQRGRGSELSNPLPEFAGRIPKKLIGRVVLEAVEIKRKSKTVIQSILPSMPQNIDGTGYAEVIQTVAMNDTRADGMMHALDLLTPRNDGDSWLLYVTDEVGLIE